MDSAHRSSRQRLKLLSTAFFLLWCVSRASAGATLFLEEPYGHFGAFTATGHAAVYLSRVCAQSPTVLRPCGEGETGVVLSRYNKVAGYDWLAIPLLPYLYAVEQPDQVPLFANPKIVAFLRNQYRKKYLETIAPDDPSGEPPGGNWTQLVGAAYDRTIYGFEIETSPDQDARFIHEYNSRPNRSRFDLLTRNCADFARGVINFYYPKTLHRNLIADTGITTPKQISKLLVKFSTHHPELQSASFVIPQVPGSVPRSTSVHGVVESVLKSKKYLLPVTFLQPVVTGILAVAYVQDGRFNPGQNAMIFEPGEPLRPALPSTQRRAYRSQFDDYLAETAPHLNARPNRKNWDRLSAGAEPQLDAEGRPVLRLQAGEDPVDFGIARGNILRTPAPPLLTEELLAWRLGMELRSRAPSVSASGVMSDWNLLKQLHPAATEQLLSSTRASW